MTSAALPSADDEPVVVRIRTPGDIVASLPALLGHHPSDSLVLLVMGGERRRLRLTMRMDLPRQADESDSHDWHDRRVVWRHVGLALLRGATRTDGHEAVLVLVDGSDEEAATANEAVADVLSCAGITLSDVLVVRDGRYRSAVCGDETCCPPEGRPVPATSAIAAAHAVNGQVVAASRADMASEVAAPTGAALDRAERVVALMRTTLPHGSVDLSEETVERELDAACAAAAEGPLPLDQAARLAIIVGSGHVRDQAYLHLVRSGPSVHRPVWASVCRQVPPSQSVVPLVLFTLSAYLMGEGSLANVALDRAREVQPAHASVRLLDDILAAGIPPATVTDALARCMIVGR